MEQEKSLEELKAAIEDDTAKLAEENGKSQEKEASEDNSDGTSKEADGSSESTDEEPSKEEWVVPGRFKTTEDLVNGYKNLESAYGRRSSEFKQLQNEVTKTARSETTSEKEERIKRFAARVTADPEGTIAEIARAVTTDVRSEVQAERFERVYWEKKKDPEFNELEPVMAQLAIEYGDLIRVNGMQNDPKLLDILHLAAKGAKAAGLLDKATKAGVKKGEELHRKKQKARIEGTSGTKSVKKLDTNKMTAAQMKEAILKGDIEI